MPLNERIYKLEQLLKNRNVVSFTLMQERTEASRATLNRDIQFMRDRLRMPIVFDKDLGGYRLDGGSGKPVQTELPGLWFNDAEIHA
ncbi:MAG: HTH domain-containing protein, partial [Sulfuricellaceae bacterium]|nr:HTH domain-containing protein [Sulfuricellaceae bacterium]